MSETEQPKNWLDENLAHELSETVATLTRLGITLAGLPIAFLPRQRREQAKQLAGEVMRIGAALPRTVGTMLDEAADEWQGGEKPREDLGTRLRREEQRRMEADAATARDVQDGIE